MKKEFSGTKLKLTEMYNRLRDYCNCKDKAKPLHIFSNCLLLYLITVTPSDLASKSSHVWLLLYLIDKNMAIFNYIIRRKGTNYIQCVDRFPILPVTPQGRVDDLAVNNFENVQRELPLGHFHRQATLLDGCNHSLLESPTTGRSATCHCQHPFTDRSSAPASRSGSWTSSFASISSGSGLSCSSSLSHKRRWSSSTTSKSDLNVLHRTFV